MRTPRPPHALHRSSVLLFALATGWTAGACCEGEVDSGPVPKEVQTAREIAAAHFEMERLSDARAALAPLLARDPVATEDVLRSAVVEYALDELERTEELLDRVGERGGESPRYHYLRGLLARGRGDAQEAAKRFRTVVDLAPDDFPSRLMLATVLSGLGKSEEAERNLRSILDHGPEYGGGWYVSALYVLSQIRMQSGEVAAAQELLKEYSTLQAQGITIAAGLDLERGTFARLEFPPPQTKESFEPAPVAVSGREQIAPDLPGQTELQALDLLEDWTVERDADGAVVSSYVGPTELVSSGPAGVFACARTATGAWSTRHLFERPVTLLRGADLGQDRDLDLWLVSDGRVLLLRSDEGDYAPVADALPALPSAPGDIEVLDFDHEGDLDLCLVGPFGVRLWRNDGFADGGTFTDVGAEAGLPGAGAFSWCVAEDLDTDQDVDLLIGGAGRTLILDNLRAGRFRVLDDRLPDADRTEREPAVADLDGDGRPDIATSDGELWLGVPGGGFRRSELTRASVPAGAPLDLNLDGDPDLLVASADGGVIALLSAGTAGERAQELFPPRTAPRPAPVAAGSFGPALVLELARGGTRGVEVGPLASTGQNAIRVALRGRKDNRRGVGAVLEVRADARYQRIFWGGEPRLIGLGPAQRADWVRVTWPNGVTQSQMNVPAGSELVIEQEEGLVGSCPFLYAFDGSTFGFVTDVLGVTPLGLPMAPGLLVPPDHDEHVLIRGDQLVPRDGVYELQLTEELREVTYLDAVRLDVVDHPAGSAVYPNERFTLPPFPEPVIHTVTRALAPLRAVDDAGRDWAAELRDDDLELAVPFQPYASADETAPDRGQFLGLTPPHTLELAFDPEEVGGAGRLRLVMTGWFYWTDASVNVASSRTPGISFQPPLLEVPDGEGGWRVAGPPLGFPAGKRKTMVVDVGHLVDPKDPRLRISSTLRLYWDRIRLAVDDGDAPVRVQPLEVASARLWQRGFSRPYALPGGHGLDWFDWDHLADLPRWNQHPGLYTRLGEVGELLADVDDRLVVFGAGDAVTLRFDASSLAPPPEGWVRDYLLFLDGWAKDRDPNSLQAEFVEPLPFHGMSGYPYGEDEHFPADELHRAWRAEWLTRPAREWIEPLRSAVVRRARRD